MSEWPATRLWAGACAAGRGHGELIASQLGDEIEGTVLGGGEDAARRFAGEPAVGDYLRLKVFLPGARRHWQATMEYATGERLQPRYFVQDVSMW